MEIKVTADHIENGVQKSPTQCPVALATQERLGQKVYVSRFLVYKLEGNGDIVWFNADSIFAAIEKYDETGKMPTGTIIVNDNHAEFYEKET